MKKTSLLAVSLALMASLWPVNSFAAEDTNAEDIDNGTIVNGEDISDLTDDELKYIPKAWRDGHSEEDADKNAQEGEKPESKSGNVSAFSTYPDVNDYIRDMDPASVKYEHNLDFPRFNYRHGKGAVEGVVAHETANDNTTIRNEIDYMSRNYNSAFVHAFVNDQQTIEIHPTDRAAWGAGRFANERFVHVELVRADTFDAFAKSINNYSDYIASILYKYNTGVDSAVSDGEGSLWSHRAVSDYLGGTTHTDPHAYFDKWGYDWNEFVALVGTKFEEKVRHHSKNTSKLGHINASSARIYDDPTKLDTYQKAGSKRTDEVFHIKAEAKLSGKQYYLISRKPSAQDGTVGWVQASDVKTHEHTSVDKKQKTFKVYGSGNAYAEIWGGSDDHVYNLSNHTGETFNVNLTEAVGHNTWYRGNLDGQEVWIHESYLVKNEKTSKLGHLRHDATIYDTLRADAPGEEASRYENKVYYIKKQADVRRNTYYLISEKPSSTKGTIGWIQASDMLTHSHTGVDKQDKTFYIDGTGSAYTKAWGDSEDHVYDLANRQNDEFNVNLTEKVGSNIWYRGDLDGKTVWLHESKVTTKQTSPTSKLGHLHSGALIYETIGDESTAFSSDDYLNAVYYIKEKASFGNQTYYLISTKASSTRGTIGWVKADSMSTHAHKGADRKSKTFVFNGDGDAFTKAWGGSKDHVYDLSDYKGAEFHAHKTETVGHNTWYRGDFKGERIFVHESFVTKVDTSPISRLGHLRSGATIYNSVGDPSSAFSAQDYLNRVYYIKEQALFAGDTYYLISTKASSTKGTIGWVKTADMSTHKHVGVDKKSKTFTVKGTGHGYDTAWGGDKNLVYDLSDYAGETFHVYLTEKVGHNTWYRGQLDGQTVWMHESFVK
ncbi:autolysin Ami [Barrientosiimonas marina]|uniref:Autolysin n=1 Tax=Lentibacillus kimchii TaxID=1542911 RepID=A0ABW2UX22_9BACI